jgi:hypothetical protein
MRRPNNFTPDEYFATTGGNVMKVGVNGGSPQTLATAQSTNVLGRMAVDSSGVYWLELTPTGGSVRRVALGGGSPTTLGSATSTSTSDNGIALDATSIYWTTTDSVEKLVKP